MLTLQLVSWFVALNLVLAIADGFHMALMPGPTFLGGGKCGCWTSSLLRLVHFRQQKTQSMSEITTVAKTESNSKLPALAQAVSARDVLIRLRRGVCVRHERASNNLGFRVASIHTCEQLARSLRDYSGR